MTQQQTTTSETDRDYLTKLMAHPDLSPQQEKRLFAGVRAGDAMAKETLITHNMRLVAATVRTNFRDQLGPRTAGGLEFTDFVDEGVIALSKAIDNYNPKFGEFTPYAERAIFNQLSKALNDQEELVRLPQNASRLERTIFKIEDDRRTQGITTPLTDEQLAEMTGETVSMVAHVRTAPRAVTSLQATTESGQELGELLADSRADQSGSEETSVLDHISANDLPVLLSRIPQKYRDPIDLHLLQGKTQEETAEQLGISPTTVAKDIRRGLGQLRRVADQHITTHESAAALQSAASKGTAL